MEQRGKNTNNTLAELKKVLADIESGKCSTDGYSGAIADIKEDIAQLERQQLTVGEAALSYIRSIPLNHRHHITAENAFKAGANWQKEQDNRLLVLLKGIAEWPGNLSDKVLQAATGPKDAALRGGMICDMRDIAIEAIRTIEPDYTPFK